MTITIYFTSFSNLANRPALTIEFDLDAERFTVDSSDEILYFKTSN